MNTNTQTSAPTFESVMAVLHEVAQSGKGKGFVTIYAHAGLELRKFGD